MVELAPLTLDRLRPACDPSALAFETTDELADLDEIVGQDRALSALAFGIGIRHDSFNLYALGSPGLGKHTLVRALLDKHAGSRPVPPDSCYLHNFADASRPCALHLPAGRGAALRGAMDQLVDELAAALPAAFDSEDFRTRKEAIEEEAKRKQEEALTALAREATKHDVVVVRTPVGVALAPARNGHALSPDEFEKLSEEETLRLKSGIDLLQGKLQDIIKRMPQWEREARIAVRTLIREVTTLAVRHLIDDLRTAFADLPPVIDYLRQVEDDVIERAAEFIRAGAHDGPTPPAGDGGDESPFQRYKVNLLVDNSGLAGAPVVYEDHPTLGNLLGRVEHVSRFGTLVTDFTLIKPGALHRANGGYLMLDARRLLMQPFAYEGLKRILRSRELRIESIGQMLSMISTVSLEPEPIPLDIKIVLIGDRLLYYLLSALDPDFGELFKVPADFAEDIPRTDSSLQSYARLIATMARRSEVRPLDRAAVARVVDHASRLAEDSEKLSIHRRALSDLLREADFWAGQEGTARIGAGHVQQALDAQIYRADRVRERVYEQIRRGTVMIDLTGEAVGQVNGLAVAQLGGFAFARPSRITARSRLGRGKVVDIEREVELGGPIHSKGVLILQGFLTARFAPDTPLTLSASLVFEQSYGGVEGDSASCAELYALLSSLAEIPIRQNLAVTGSVDQLGRVQAIGGVNEKVEGFFDVCHQAGLTGTQGVLIPAANVPHLMLRQDVVDAVGEGRFRVYAVETVDQGLELLTGRPAGERGADGQFPEETVNRLVEDRLLAFARAAKAFAESRDERSP
ncbi:MAG: AAA family ATPase [Inquilinus sp.]|nr:AAA family ATPase [Inquilinus sp.]